MFKTINKNILKFCSRVLAVCTLNKCKGSSGLKMCLSHKIRLSMREKVHWGIFF